MNSIIGRVNKLNIQKLKVLLKQGEGPKLDFKETIDIELESGKKELVKDIIAIANSQGGRGHLILGVKDRTKEIIGIDPSICNEERIQQIVSYRCDPPINIRVEYTSYNNKTIGIITIFRSNNKPHQMRQTGAFYIRRGSTTDFARRDEIANMLQKGGLINNEQIPMFNVDIDVLNKEMLRDYFRKNNLGDYVDDKILLSNLGIIHYDRDSDQYYPTIGGVLLFCDNPQIYLPHTGIKLIYSSDKIDRLEKYFSGNIIKLLDSTMNFIRDLFENKVYPIDALEESIGNALVHRDYFDYSREIVVVLGNKTIEVSNPGTISQKERINNIIKEENPIRRNNWIYHKILVIDEKRRFMKSGLGLNKIKNSFEGLGNVKFINIRKNNLFKVILPGLNMSKY